jgi:hypothetical protein
VSSQLDGAEMGQHQLAAPLGATLGWTEVGARHSSFGGRNQGTGGGRSSSGGDASGLWPEWTRASGGARDRKSSRGAVALLGNENRRE